MDYFSELYMIGENSEFEPRPEVKEVGSPFSICIREF